MRSETNNFLKKQRMTNSEEVSGIFMNFFLIFHAKIHVENYDKHALKYCDPENRKLFTSGQYDKTRFTTKKYLNLFSNLQDLSNRKGSYLASKFEELRSPEVAPKVTGTCT